MLCCRCFLLFFIVTMGLRAPGSSCSILLQHRVQLSYTGYISVKDAEEVKTTLVVS